MYYKCQKTLRGEQIVRPIIHNSFEQRRLELQLDKEWVSLITLAKIQGVSIDDVRNFFKEKRNSVNTNQN
nr:anti-repressor SinI family protein [Lederbergia wuyishanensis]